ncbi:hypothetical protein TSMEX_010644 [Taenia solium]|eukprot:TsM_001231300 transcript=TsM_001231300 gene=TsM_001231300
MGHVGEEKMMEVSSKRYWCPPLSPNLLDLCRICIACCKFKKSHSTASASLQPMPTVFPDERVEMDIMGSRPLTE